VDHVTINSVRDGFTVSVLGKSHEALVTRRLISQFSADPPGDPAEPQVTYRIPRSRVKSVLLALAPHLQQIGVQLKRDEATSLLLAEIRGEVGSLRAALEGRLKPSRFELGPSFQRTLTSHQRAAVATLLSLPHGANFSVPGAGKTTVTLALHDVLRSRGLASRLIVIAPRNAFQPWEEEVRACYSQPPPVVRLAGGIERISQLLSQSDGNSILLISYQQAYFALDMLEKWFSEQEKLHLVLDESHRIKNPKRGAWANTVLRLASMAARRDILTGTPAPNALEDLATQVSFLWPFQTVLPDVELRDPGAEDAITERLRPLFVRTTKKQLGLPKATITQVPIAMGAIQRQIHDRVKQRIARSGPKVVSTQDSIGQIRANVIRLLQLSSNPALVLSSAEEFRVPPLDLSEDQELDELFAKYQEYEIPPKFTYAVKKVRERVVAGKKTIIWSSFVRNLEMLEKLLKGFGPIVLHGGVPTALDMEEVPESSREARLAKFKEDRNCWVLVANPAACSESISLHHHCDFALYLDRTFNAAAFLQSMDRIHRLGLPKTAKIGYELLVSPGTIDEVVDRRLSEKIRRLGRVLDDESLRTINLDLVDEESTLAFDLEDARQVIEFLREQSARG
jgi:SNF2 family DNA or RNA helicase